MHSFARSSRPRRSNCESVLGPQNYALHPSQADVWPTCAGKSGWAATGIGGYPLPGGGFARPALIVGTSFGLRGDEDVGTKWEGDWNGNHEIGTLSAESRRIGALAAFALGLACALVAGAAYATAWEPDDTLDELSPADGWLRGAGWSVGKARSGHPRPAGMAPRGGSPRDSFGRWGGGRSRHGSE